MDKSNIMCLHIGIAFYSFVLMEQKYREARRGSRYFALRHPVFSGYRPMEQTNREPQGSRCLLQKMLRRPVFSGSLTFIFAIKISLLQVISFALPAGPIFDRPKIGEKGTAHRRTFGKATPRVICVSKLRWESAGHEIRGVPEIFSPLAIHMCLWGS